MLTAHKSLDIQALRGISLIGVLLYHSFSSHFPGGYLGVDVFFVISGFVITPLLLKTFGDQQLSSWGKLKDFLTKRFFRLVPALIVSILTSGVLLYVFSPLEDHIRIARQGISSLFMMGNIGAVFFSGNYFSPNPNPFIHTWSLGVESQIYLFMPICFLVLSSWRYSFEKIVLRLLIVISILSVILFFISINLSVQEIFSEFSYYSPIARVWQFSIGGIAFIVASKKRRSTQKIWVYHFLLAVLILIFLFPVGSNTFIASIVATFISGTILVLQSLLTLPRFLLSPLCWLGNRSYSIYLYHMPFIYLAKFSPVLKSEYQEVKTVVIFLSVVISILIGSISYSLIENRFWLSSKSIAGSRIEKRFLTATFLLTLLTFFAIDRAVLLQYPSRTDRPYLNLQKAYDWDRNCKFMKDETDPDLNEPWACIYPAKNGIRNILLIGDSHAATVSKEIIRYGELNQANVYISTFASCRFILRQASEERRIFGVSENCLTHNANILKLIEETEFSHVIYSHRSSEAEPLDSRSSLNFRILNDLQFLESKVPALVFLGLTPEFNFPNSIYQFMLNAKTEVRKTAISENSYWISVLNSSSIQYLDVFPIFCESLPSCEMKNSQGWFFEDDNHLSELGGRRLKFVLASI